MYRSVIHLAILFQVMFTCSVFAQRYNFEHYDIEDGLVQSQVRGITQDSNRRLWIATLGGLSYYNGKQFCDYGRNDGLPGNFCTDVISKGSNLFIGTTEGISRFDYKSFYSYQNHKRGDVQLIQTIDSRLYALQGRKLFEVFESTTRLVSITDNDNEIVTAISRGPDGILWAAVYKQGLFYLKNHKWHEAAINPKIKDLTIHCFLIQDPVGAKAILLSRSGIYNVTKTDVSSDFSFIKNWPTSIAIDRNGSYWIGTTHGAWRLSAKGNTHFTSTNGLTESEVSTLYVDIEGNIWLGTNGDGLYRYSGDNYLAFDDTQGLRSKIVMALAASPNKDEVLIGTTNGLYKNINGVISEMILPFKRESSRSIVFLTSDLQKNIWIGTTAGLWLYDGKSISSVSKQESGYFFSSMMGDNSGDILLSSDQAQYRYDIADRQVKLILNGAGGKLIELDEHTMIAGGQQGAYLISKAKSHKSPVSRKIFSFSILSMLKVGENILFGTSDYGVFIWNTETKSIKNLSSKNGLSSDHIYSMMLDHKGSIWLGTGKGVSKLRAADFSIIKNPSSQYLLAESNQNAILETSQGVWIGTTKGAVLYPADQPSPVDIKPYIYISSVNANSKSEDGTAVLPYDENRITINYTGVYFRNSSDIRYSYRLLGLDTAWSLPSSDASITYRAIPAGKYIFEVKVKTTHGTVSENVAVYPFVISKPYHQTGLFRLLVLLLTGCLILFSVYAIFTWGERRRKLRLKIKLEEQAILRTQTAEDFHDDLGNKLTRITVLSEVLKSMIDLGETEKLGVLSKIVKNVDDLYSGTRDILWSLNPKNDHLNQLLEHVRDFGVEMFNNTSILFSYEISLNGNNTRLSLDLSRNILMILKESINNVLKHSGATTVCYSAVLNSEFLLITLEDNGRGFNVAYAKNGHGVNNMYVRAKRIDADLSLQSSDSGTSVCLMINFSTLKQNKNV